MLAELYWPPQVLKLYLVGRVWLRFVSEKCTEEGPTTLQ